MFEFLFLIKFINVEFDSHFFVSLTNSFKGAFAMQAIATLRLVRNAYNKTQPKNKIKDKFNRCEPNKSKKLIILIFIFIFYIFKFIKFFF